MEYSHNQSKKALINTFFILVSALFIYRLLFTFNAAGYGMDDDAWRIGYAAGRIAETNSYHASRLPGYPLVEIFLSTIIKFGPMATNAATALIGAVGIGFFYLTLQHLEIKNSLVWSALLAITPIIHIYSTTSMDYIWGLSFLLISLYYIYKEKSLTAGVFLGLAIASRITSGAMLFIFSGLLWDKTKNTKTILKFGITSLAVGGVFYLPLFLQQGFSFLQIYYDGSVPQLVRLVGMLTVNIWGHLGSIALGVWVIYQAMKFIREKRPWKLTISLEEGLWAGAVLLYLVLWSRAPLTAGYLIPIVPFIFLFLAKYSDKKILVVFAVLFVFSGFVKIKPFELEPGMILEDMAARQEQVETIDNLYNYFSALDHPALVYLRSDWVVYMRMKMEENLAKDLLFEIHPEQNILENYFENGYTIYYEENINFFSDASQTDPTAYEAIPFSINELAELGSSK